MTFFDLTGLGHLRRASARLRATPRARGRLSTRQSFATAVLCLLVVAALSFARWQIEGAVVPWDSKNHFYPMFRFLGDALRHGTLPLWNPYHFGGYPAVADPQSLIFTPSMVLFALLAPDASMEVFDAVILLHLVVGGIGMLGLAWRRRWHPAAGVLAALIFMLGGAASSRLQHTGMIISYAWFPLAVWSLEAALAGAPCASASSPDLRDLDGARPRSGRLSPLHRATRDRPRRRRPRRSPLAYLRSRAPVLACAGLVTLGLMITPILLTLQFIHDFEPARYRLRHGAGWIARSDQPGHAFRPEHVRLLDQIYDYWGPGAATAAGNDWTDRRSIISSSARCPSCCCSGMASRGGGWWSAAPIMRSAC